MMRCECPAIKKLRAVEQHDAMARMTRKLLALRNSTIMLRASCWRVNSVALIGLSAPIPNSLAQ